MWLVKIELVPGEGAQERTREELTAIAEAIERQFPTERVLAHGGVGRFVVFAQVRSSSEGRAESWAREVLYEAVADALPDWRLDVFEV